MANTPEGRGTDPRVRRFISPTRVVWHSTAGPSTEAAAVLTAPGATGQAIVRSKRRCQLGPGAGLLLDFGRELNGGVRIVTGDNQPRVGRVRIRFGESVSEAMGQPNNDHSLHDSVHDLPWQGALEVGATGFRFVRVDHAGKEGTVELREVEAVAVYRDLEYVGSFRCSDDRLNEIWQTGAYTVHLNMQEYVWDGIKRDRLVWIGDLHPELRVICSVFDDDGVVPISLDLVRDETPLPGYMNGISAYSLWWIINQRDWYWYKGDWAYLRQQHAYLAGLLRQLAGCIDSTGREQLPHKRLLDWPTQANEAAKHAGLQALMAWAFRAGEEICRELGDDESGKLCFGCRSLLQGHVPDAGLSKQANALQALAGFAPAPEVNQQVLSRDPVNGLSTFFGFYVLQARALAGDFQGALDVIRRYWGAMLDFGATTFWEDFDLAWTHNAGRIDELPKAGKADLHADFGDYCYKGLRHSLCHGWAAGPTAWLSEHILGIRPTEPGCEVVLIEPHLADLEWAEGTFPTPLGPIRVRHERDSRNQVLSQISVPDGVRLKVGP